MKDTETTINSRIPGDVADELSVASFVLRVRKRTMIEDGIRRELEALQQKYNHGRPFRERLADSGANSTTENAPTSANDIQAD